MKLLVGMDGNGHFMVAHPTDRIAVLDLLQKIQDGDYFSDVISDYDIRLKRDLNDYCCQTWDSIVGHFIQRGTLEYIEVTDTVPIGCKCE
jgi:hypothetical protein